MKKPQTFVCWLLCLLLWSGLAAAQALETITLRYQLAEQLMPQLRPLLAPGGALTGRGEVLFVRTTPANLEELRQMIALLDRAPRRLVISVRHDGRQAGQGIGAGVQGGLAHGRERRSENVAQRVQTVEGGRAYINVGQSLPLALRQVVPTPQGPMVSESIAYREVGSGFYVEPRLTGDRVTLAISTAQDTPGRLPGSAEVRHVSSVVSGRLGEWIPLAGSTQQSARDSRGLGGQAVREASDDRQVWLMVEELP